MRLVFNPDVLASSLREMITADIHVQMIQCKTIRANSETLSAYQEQYSRHETIVREQFAALNKLARKYKPPTRYK